ncbi:MAG: hypothetical protein E7K72_22250, partial [Roseomonas mucosa]|nr:hypothetical protein [Roseomonas mucosa]
MEIIGTAREAFELLRPGVESAGDGAAAVLHPLRREVQHQHFPLPVQRGPPDHALELRQRIRRQLPLLEGAAQFGHAVLLLFLGTPCLRLLLGPLLFHPNHYFFFIS